MFEVAVKFLFIPMAVKRCDHSLRITNRKMLIIEAIIRDDADALFNFDFMFRHIKAEYFYTAGIGTDHAEHHLD